jgi:predicted alpha/beta hydrolase
VITDAILGIGVQLLGALINLLPASSGQSFTGMSAAFSSALGANSVVPVVTLMACLLPVVAFNLARVAFWVGSFIYSHIPFIG